MHRCFRFASGFNFTGQGTPWATPGAACDVLNRDTSARRRHHGPASHAPGHVQTNRTRPRRAYGGPGAAQTLAMASSRAAAVAGFPTNARLGAASTSSVT